MKIIALSFLLACALAPAFSQTIVHVAHGCAYTDAVEDATFFTIEPIEEAQRIVSGICTTMGMTQNFELRAADVENVLAANDDGRRFILYSPSFLRKIRDDARNRWEVYAVLAHEIGHHFHRHNLTEENSNERNRIELEADHFSGAVLQLLGANLTEAKASLEILSFYSGQSYHYPSVNIRIEAVIGGWLKEKEYDLPALGPRASQSILDIDSDGVPDLTDKCPYAAGPTQYNGCPDTDNDGVPDPDDACPQQPGKINNKGCPGNPIPAFPWPPPKCFLRERLIQNLKKHAATFHQVDDQLQRVLDAKGYRQRGYYSIPGGFVLVTQLEQFDKKGNVDAASRWVDYPVHKVENVWDYLSALVLPRPGYFRVFVFAVTDQPYVQSEKTISKEAAGQLVHRGANMMTAAMRKTEITAEHYLDVLIYEFEHSEATGKCKQKCPCLLDSLTHLSKSGLLISGF